MSTQDTYMFIFMLLTLAQVYCAIRAFRSDRPIGRYTGRLNFAILVPIVANIFITKAYGEEISVAGYYLSYAGMTLILLSLVHFTSEYCKGVDPGKKHRKPVFIYVLGVLDIIQLALGPVLHHVFTIEEIVFEDAVYYSDRPLIGLTIHRAIDYIIYGCTLMIYIVCAKKAARLYREKFIVIMCTMLASGVIQGLFIFTRTPIDKSIIVHGIFGIIVYYFSVVYRPLRLLDALLTGVASNLKDAVFVFDAAGHCVWVNDAGSELLNLNGSLGHVKEDLIDMFGDLTMRGEEWSEDVHVDATDRYYIIEKQTVRSGNNTPDGSFIVIKDRTERHKAMEQELYDSTHDKVTKLYNMTYLYRQIQDVMKKKKDDPDYCVVYMNIRNFKIVNDIFGNRFGDHALWQLSRWIENTFKDKALYGRLIGDTFGIFMPWEDFDENVFLDGLGDYRVCNGDVEHRISIHIGIYQITDKTLDVSVMFDRAHMAISAITDNYKTCVKVYDDALRSSILEEQRLLLDINEALENNQIMPYLQSITDSVGKIVGAEALARWNHPELGFLSPSAFIPVFEKNGMIVEVDRHIWEEACKILDSWKDTYPDLFISINISPKDFYFIDVVYEIEELVAKYDIDHKNLRIEITESAMMSDTDERIKIFDRLRNAGFIVEMDDFGSGYSSLNLLKDMPVDVLKIDMNFLSKEGNSKSDTIVKNVINLSNELNMTALTEGVETQKQYQMLLNMGCCLFQGYYFSKPLPVDQFEQQIKRNKMFFGRGKKDSYDNGEA